MIVIVALLFVVAATAIVAVADPKESRHESAGPRVDRDRLTRHLADENAPNSCELELPSLWAAALAPWAAPALT
jgi:hypothetical protein